MKSIGEQVQAYMAAHKLNSTQMAARVSKVDLSAKKVNRQDIDNLTKGDVEVPRYVKQLAKLMGCTIDSLMGVETSAPSAGPHPGGMATEYSPEAAGVAEIVELLPSVEEKEAFRVLIRSMVLDRMVSIRRAHAGSSSEKQSDPPNDRQAPDAS